MTRLGFVSARSRRTAPPSTKSYSLDLGTKISVAPRARSLAVTEPPRNPAPPVTTTRALLQSIIAPVRLALPRALIVIREGAFTTGKLEIAVHHHSHQSIEANLGLPA